MARSMFALPSTITQVLRFFQVTNSSKTANEKKKKISSPNTIMLYCFLSSPISYPSEKGLAHPRQSWSGTVGFNQSTVAVSHWWPGGIFFPEYIKDCYPES